MGARPDPRAKTRPSRWLVPLPWARKRPVSSLPDPSAPPDGLRLAGCRVRHSVLLVALPAPGPMAGERLRRGPAPRLGPLDGRGSRARGAAVGQRDKLRLRATQLYLVRPRSVGAALGHVSPPHRAWPDLAGAPRPRFLSPGGPCGLGDGRLPLRHRLPGAARHRLLGRDRALAVAAAAGPVNRPRRRDTPGNRLGVGSDHAGRSLGSEQRIRTQHLLRKLLWRPSDPQLACHWPNL